MSEQVYTKLLEITSAASPDLLKNHVRELQQEGQLNSILSTFISSWSNSGNQDDIENTQYNLKGISLLMNNIGLDSMDSIIEDLEKGGLSKDIEKMIGESATDFVSLFEIEKNPENAFALLLMVNIVDVEAKAKLMEEIKKLDIDIFIKNPEISEFFRYTLQNYIDALEQDQEKKLQHGIALELMSELHEKRDKASEENYVSVIDQLLERIASNKISNIELNFAMTTMPALAIIVAQNFTSFPENVKGNLADNVFPALGNTPIGRLCNDIVESRSDLKVDLPNEASKQVKAPKNKVVDKAIADVKAIKTDLSEGKINKVEAAGKIDAAIAPVKPELVKSAVLDKGSKGSKDTGVKVSTVSNASPKAPEVQGNIPESKGSEIGK